jgi:hypothetical protein
MECPECLLSFEFEKGASRFPRILIVCGHSVCEECLKLAMESKNLFNCPECGEKSKVKCITSFPKNLALARMNDPTAT